MGISLKLFRSILCVLVAFAILTSSIGSVFASDVPALPSPGGAGSGGTTVVYDIGDLIETVKGVVEIIGDVAGGVEDFFYDWWNDELDYRSERLEYYDKALTFWTKWFGSPDSEDESSYDDFVSSLDTPTASSSIAVSGFSCSQLYNYSDQNVYGFTSFVGAAYPEQMTQLLQSLGVNQKVAICNISKDGSYLLGYYWNEDGMLCTGTFENPLGEASADSFGVYSLADLTLVSSARPSVYYGEYNHNWGDPYYSYVYPGNYELFYSAEYAESWADFSTTPCYAMDWDNGGFATDTDKDGKTRWCISGKYKSGSGVEWTSNKRLWIRWTGGVAGDEMYTVHPDYISWDNSRILIQPSGTDESSRVALLMELIQQYNEKMDCLNNSDATNYFFGTVDEDGNVTGYYSPSVFSEETRIFTEPVTGAQYQTTGWTYDYETRTYDMFLEPGTFVLEGSDVIRILCTYGDYGVTITYIHPDGSAARVDEYAYLVVAANECALNGHTNSIETTKEATCLTPGERIYTCSVCGNQTVETVPVLEHTGVLLEVVDTVYGESGAVITAGYALYECLSCGRHYIVYDDAVSGTGTGFWSSLVDSFANALSSAIDAILGLIIYVLETVLELIKELLSFLFSFITDTVLGGISNMFAAFTDGSLFEFFQTEDGGVALPGDISIVFGFFSGVILALPLELRSILFLAIAAGVLIAIFKLS